MEDIVTMIETFLAHSDEKLEELSQRNQALLEETSVNLEEEQ